MIRKKNTHNFNHFSKMSSDNYLNAKNMISPKVDYLLLKGESNANTNTNTKNN